MMTITDDFYTAAFNISQKRPQNNQLAFFSRVKSESLNLTQQVYQYNRFRNWFDGFLILFILQKKYFEKKLKRNLKPKF